MGGRGNAGRAKSTVTIMGISDMGKATATQILHAYNQKYGKSKNIYENFKAFSSEVKGYHTQAIDSVLRFIGEHAKKYLEREIKKENRKKYKNKERRR